MRLVTVAAMMLAATVFLPAGVYADEVGSTLLGVTVVENRQVAEGWSATTDVLGKPVFNDTGDVIGIVDDLIITPDRDLSYAIVGVSGFLGLGARQVAIPANQFSRADDKLVLKGATHDQLMKMPQFEYKKK